MGVIQVTARPSKYVRYDEQEKVQIRRDGIPKPDNYTASCGQAEAFAWKVANDGLLTVRLVVGGIKDTSMRYKQKRILDVMNQSIYKKGTFVRNYCNSDDYGFYQWEQFILHGNVIIR